MPIHFIYALPPNTAPPARRDQADTSNFPPHSPYSITHHLYQFLRQKTPVFLYHFMELGLIPGAPNDILLGHPVMESTQAAWNLSFAHGRFAARIAMFPLHHHYAETNAHFDPYIPNLDTLLAIQGPYWNDTLGQSPFAHWKDKITRLDMAIDTTFYPRLKKSFNPPGQRKFLFIGNSSAVKGTHLLSILFGVAKQKGLPHQCVWIGSDGRFPNLQNRPTAKLTPEYMTPLLNECDFFLTMGVSDANPTTILEAMAWGLPVACTPQSGYYNMPEIFTEMSITNMDHNLQMLEQLQDAPEQTLMARANAARQLVESHYTWPRFTGAVWSVIERLAREKNIKLEVGS